MKKLFFLLSFVALTAFVQAQVSPVSVAIYDQELFATAVGDTLVNTDSIKLVWRNYTSLPHQANLNIIADEVSGTATLTAKVQVSAVDSPGTAINEEDWFTLYTYSITTDTTIFVNWDLLFGRRVRLIGTTSGTGRYVLTPTFTVKRQETSY